MINASGVAKLADLGLAKTATVKETASESSDEVLGTPQYISPEQLTGVDTATRAGDSTKAAIEAMCYNIGKEVGAMAAVLHGKVDAIILTGGIAYNKMICGKITDMVGFIAPVIISPGENEMEALAANALRVMEGRLEAKEYI